MNRIVEIKELNKVVPLKKAIRTASVLTSALTLAVSFHSCSSAHQRQKTPDFQKDSWLGSVGATGSTSKLRIQKLWTRSLDGYITELSLSGQGNAVLVATLPDYDHENGSRKNLLRYFDGNGRERWHEVMPTQVKSQALSRDGALAIATTHEDQVMAFDSRGEKLWTANATCMPFVIESRKEILCYHDDDAEPLVAFDVFDWHGRLKRSFPIKNDILALKVSKDEQHVAIALTKGNVQLLGPDYAVQWSAQLPGEIVDVALTGGSDPKVSVLYSVGVGKSQKVALIQGGKLLSEGTPLGRVNQIAFAPDTASIFAYGNGESGQYISRFQSSPVSQVQELWRHGVENNAHYTQSLFVSDVSAGNAVHSAQSKSQLVGPLVTQAIIGVEQVSAGSRQSEVVGLDKTGALLWTLPVTSVLGAEEGAFLYGQSWASGPARLAISTDDRHFGVFQVVAGK
jgi:hypothetical protein